MSTNSRYTFYVARLNGEIRYGRWHGGHNRVEFNEKAESDFVKFVGQYAFELSTTFGLIVESRARYAYDVSKGYLNLVRNVSSLGIGLLHVNWKSTDWVIQVIEGPVTLTAMGTIIFTLTSEVVATDTY